MYHHYLDIRAHRGLVEAIATALGTTWKVADSLTPDHRDRHTSGANPLYLTDGECALAVAAERFGTRERLIFAGAFSVPVAGWVFDLATTSAIDRSPAGIAQQVRIRLADAVRQETIRAAASQAALDKREAELEAARRALLAPLVRAGIATVGDGARAATLHRGEVRGMITLAYEGDGGDLNLRGLTNVQILEVLAALDTGTLAAITAALLAVPAGPTTA